MITISDEEDMEDNIEVTNDVEVVDTKKKKKRAKRQADQPPIPVAAQTKKKENDKWKSAPSIDSFFAPRSATTLGVGDEKSSRLKIDYDTIDDDIDELMNATESVMPTATSAKAGRSSQVVVRTTSSLFSKTSSISSLSSSSSSSKQQQQQPNMRTQTQTWADKYAPTTERDLCMHVKKISDIRIWLETNLQARAAQHQQHQQYGMQNPNVHATAGQTLLLLSGPSGSGKSIMLQVTVT